MSDTVTVTAPVSYMAWQTPKFATIAMPAGKRQEGFKPSSGIAIEELPPAVVDALAAQWLDHLYASLGRETPFGRI